MVLRQDSNPRPVNRKSDALPIAPPYASLILRSMISTSNDIVLRKNVSFRVSKYYILTPFYPQTGNFGGKFWRDLEKFCVIKALPMAMLTCKLPIGSQPHESGIVNNAVMQDVKRTDHENEWHVAQMLFNKLCIVICLYVEADCENEIPAACSMPKESHFVLTVGLLSLSLSYSSSSSFYMAWQTASSMTRNRQ